MFIINYKLKNTKTCNHLTKYTMGKRRLEKIERIPNSCNRKVSYNKSIMSVYILYFNIIYSITVYFI